jgi:hypothetical protein
MKFSAIKGLIGAVAPTIGAALGGPVGLAQPLKLSHNSWVQRRRTQY